jgi:hypothetical protein
MGHNSTQATHVTIFRLPQSRQDMGKNNNDRHPEMTPEILRRHAVSQDLSKNRKAKCKSAVSVVEDARWKMNHPPEHS